MTDQYTPGSEADPQTTETEQNPAEGKTADTWSDDQPPVDDFADPEQTAEGEATISHEGEEVATDTTPVVENNPRKSMFLPVAAGIGGLIFLGAVAWWQFGRSPPATQPSPMVATLKATPPTTSTASVTPPSPATSSVDMNAIYASTHQAPPAPASVEPTSPSSPSPVILDTAPTTALTLPGAAPASAPSAAPPVVKPLPLPTPMTAVISTAPPAPSATSESTDARLAALTSRLDELEKSLDHVNGQLTQLNTVAASNPILEDRLGRIEQQFLQMKHNQESAPSTEEMPAVKKPVVHKTSSHKIMSSTSHKTPTHTTKTTSSSSAVTHWVLRAATPGEAWVSENATSPELRHVEVGETLSGIGRISAIRQVGDSWVIEGSSGSVR
jgi:uncharacterized coiled-coil protein SlyX